MPLTIHVNVDSALLLQKLENGHKRLAFGVASAINKTLLDVQVAQRDRARQEFTLRGNSKDDRSFFMRQVAIIKPKADPRQGRPYGEISIGQAKRLLLTALEEGGERKPATEGAKSVAVPVIGGPARPSFGQSVPTALEFRRLQLRKTPRREGQKLRRRKKDEPKRQDVRFGLQGTYQVPGVGVFQHQDGGGSRLVYAFVKHEQLPDDKKLDFVAVAQRVIDKEFARALEDEVEDALIRRGLTRASLS